MSGPINGVIVAITFRATMGRRRALLFAAPAIVLIAVAAALAGTATSGSWRPEFLADFGFTIVLPLTSLIIGTSVLGAEIDDGSVVHLLATPVRRSSVIVSKYAVAVGLTMLLVAVPEFVAALIATGGATKLAMGLLVGALAGSVIYNALFVMLSAVTTRAMAAGLIYVLIWEGLLSNIIGGVRILSAGHYALGIVNAISPNKNLEAGLSLGTAVGMGIVVTVGALILAARRLSSFGVSGEAT